MLVELVRESARGVLVREGAMALTLTCGASSAARDRVSPSSAALAAEMLAWNGSPDCAATEEKKIIEACSARRRDGRTCWRRLAAPRTFTW